MSRASPRVRAGVVLAATLLPLCVFASPLRLQLSRCDSSITDIPTLSAQTLQERTVYGLTQALKLEQGKATLVPAGEPESPELLVAGTLGRNGTKFRLVYTLQTKQEPKLQTQLAYEFANPRLSDRGVTVMAQEIIAEGVKLEEARKAQAAQRSVPAVASAPAATPSGAESVRGAPSRTETVREAPAAEASRESVEYEAPVEARKERKQPLVVVHSGLAGLWGYGTRSFGIGAVIEPKWNITDSIAAGIRVDGGVLFGGRIVPEGTTSIALGASAATLLKGEFLLGDSGVRPFVGLGAGLYTLANQSVSASSEGAGVAQSGGRFYGIAPQLGLDFGGVRLGVTYNHILGADIVIEQNISAGIQAERIQRNYVQLELSFRMLKFGGPENRAVPSGY
jgi:hypothetical protein